MGIIEDAHARQAARPEPRRIDYERMNAVFPRQKAELTRAKNAVNRASEGLSYWERRESQSFQQAVEKLAQVIKRHVAVWNEIGAWPDAWHTWQIALDDALGWPDHIDIGDL
jgi:hypothetical protein